jgi:hypothetical protein
MKTDTPQRHRDTENSRPVRRGTGRYGSSAWIFSLSLCLCGSGLAATSLPGLPGRLFYTPEQRAQLEAARIRNVTQAGQTAAPDAGVTPPTRYDGMLIRSDGKTTRWVNGRPQAGTSGVAGLRPGQIRADGHVYEPYQVLRPGPATPVAEEPVP